MQSYTARNKGTTVVILISIAVSFFVLIRFGYRYNEFSGTHRSSDPIEYQILEKRATKGRNARCVIRISHRGNVSEVEISSDELSGIDIGSLPEVYESARLGVFSLWERYPAASGPVRFITSNALLRATGSTKSSAAGYKNGKTPRDFFLSGGRYFHNRADKTPTQARE